MGYFVKNRRLQSGSTGVVLPTGTSSNRPQNPVFGMIRYNTTVPAVEYFDGSVWNYLLYNNGAGIYTVDNFTGDGSTTVYTMSIQVASASQIMVFVGSIYQTPGGNGTPQAYTVNGGYDITFTSAPPNGITINVIHTSL
jgi:hypothetical protein